MSRRKVYALYHGDEFVDLGTIVEIANRQGVKPNTIKFYATPSGQRKRNWALIKIEDDEEDNRDTRRTK